MEKASSSLWALCSSPTCRHIPRGETLASQAAVFILDGANPNAHSAEGTALFRAVSCGIGQPTGFQLMQQARTSEPPRSAWRPADGVALVRLLLDASANPNLRTMIDGGYSCPLFKLCEIGAAPHLIQMLVHAGADTEGRALERGDGKGSYTSLIVAAQKGYADTVKELLAVNANVDACRQGWTQLTALHAACENNHPACAKLIIEAGADLELCKMGRDGAPDKQTALLLSADKGWAECVSMLIDAGADTTATFIYKGRRYSSVTTAVDELSRGTGPAACDWPRCIRLLTKRADDAGLLAALQCLAFASSASSRLGRASIVHQLSGDLHELISGHVCEPKSGRAQRQTITAVLRRGMRREDAAPKPTTAAATKAGAGEVQRNSTPSLSAVMARPPPAVPWHSLITHAHASKLS